MSAEPVRQGNATVDPGPEIDLRRLTPAQWDGRACCRCGGVSGPMQPLTLVIGTALFEHMPGCCASAR